MIMRPFILVIALVQGIPLEGSANDHDYVDGEVLVRFISRASQTEIAQFEQAHDLTLLSDVAHLRLRHYRLPEGLTVEKAIEILSLHPVVEYAEPNAVHRLQVIPSDPRFQEQWSLHNTGQVVEGIRGRFDADIDWPEAMDIHRSIAPVAVAVIDTGIALDHPELLTNTWVNPSEIDNGRDDDGNGFVDDLFGWNFIDGNRVPLDDVGHGTSVASVIASVQGNGEGGAGVAPAARIMSLRVADEIRRFGGPIVATSNFLMATTYAARNGARIINYSAATSRLTNSERLQIDWLDSRGVLLIAAAGNGRFFGDVLGDNNDTLPVYPASFPQPNVIAVAATDSSDGLTFWSNFGLQSVDLAAPGTDILTADVNRSSPIVEGFESGAPGWTIGSSCPLGCDDWSIWLDAIGNRWATDGSAVFGVPVDYFSFTDSWMTSPRVQLQFGPSLFFTEWHDLGSGDRVTVEISIDNGLSWWLLDQYTGFSFSPAPGTSILAGTPRLIDLTGYEGQAAHFRFRLLANGSSQADGVYIDNVIVSNVDIFVYDGTQYQFASGTSFSAPLVAGVAALIMSQRPDLTHREVRQLILDNVDLKSDLVGKVATGGRLNARKALAAAIAVPEPDELARLVALMTVAMLCARRRLGE